jgi:uncharacterized membrane protein
VSLSLHLTLINRLRAYFFAGILVTAPVGITFYLAWLFIDFVDRSVKSLVPNIYAGLPGISIPGIGLLAALLGFTLIGALTAGFVGRLVVRLNDAVLAKLPVARGVYSAIKQILETVLAKKSNAFREAVLVEYPRKGVWTLGFLAGEAAPSIARAAGDQMAEKGEMESGGGLVAVFIPTTPNPTSGFLMFFPKADIRPLPIAVEDGLKYVVSCGVVMPEERG